MIRAVVLDFDGIILESVDVKGRAFLDVFADYPQHAKAILDYHYANSGVSRYDKFRHIHKHILNVPLSQEAFGDLCRRFADLALQRVLKADFVAGAQEFLQAHHRRLDLFVVSAAPDEELTAVVRARGLAGFFKDVHGSSRSKSAWTKTVLERGPYLPEEVVWVGDALSDWQAAADHGIRFLGRVIDGRDVFQDRPVAKKFLTMNEVGAYLEEGAWAKN